MQNKGWSIYFGVILLGAFLLFAIAPFVGWWLPANVSTFGPDVDYLFYVILAFTGFFFVLTEALLVYAMYRFAWRPNTKSQYVEGNHRLELLWTIVPAAILLFIAFAQIHAWETIKYKTPKPDLCVQVMARQWDWSMRYANEPTPDNPRAWAEIPAIDDTYIPDEFHCWKGANVVIYLKTQDVLHSLFFPQFRLKQDALPGKTIPMWVNVPSSSNTSYDAQLGKWEPEAGKEWEITCAELCGGGHYRMRGLVYVHETKEDYLKWLKHAQEAARSRQPEKKAPVVAAKD